ncbi:MAG: peptide-binding protein [Candidatus Omnitrophota bacterium]
MAWFNLSYGQDYGGRIIEGSSSDARTFIPILASDSASAGICGMIFNGLVKYDKDINLVGDLAESWDIEDQGKTVIFHLRKNVLWQDEAIFTAKDVEFTYQKLIDPNTKTPYSGDFKEVESLDIIDDYTIKVRYKEPFSPGLASWAMPIMPRHILENQNLDTTNFSHNPIGTGPYKLKKWVRQTKIELEVNPNYFEGRPYIDKYVSRIISDPATLFLELQTGAVDLTGITPLQYKRQTDTKFFKENYQKFRWESFTYVYLGYNLSNEKFKDIRVRKALNYAVDKQQIIKIVLLGLGRECTGPFVPESWAYNKEIIPAAYDPKEALSLLKEAGWQDNDGDGWLDKDGKIFEFTIITNQGNDLRTRTAEIIQHELSKIGIKVKIKVIEWTAFLSEFINKKKFEAVILGWSLGRDPDCFDIWHSSKTKEGEFNFIGYSNKNIDRLLIDARRTFNIDERKRYYHEIHRMLYEEQPYMFLYVPDSLTIINKKIKGIAPAPIGIGYNFIKWWILENQKSKCKIQN